MDRSARMPRLGRKTLVLLGALVAIALLLLLFDWNWLRPSLEHYLSKKSGREVRAEHMAVTGLLTFEPTVIFRGAYIQNASWADTKQPMAVAGEASFTFALRGLIDDHTVVSRIVLKDAEIDMEKQVDGLRNWRLKNPEDIGPAKVSVLRLEAYRTKLRFVDRHPDRPFDITFAATDAEAEGAKNRTGKPLSSRIEAEGIYRGGGFKAQVLTSPLITFRETQEFFPVRGHAIAGATRLELDGEAADMFFAPQLNATVRLAGQSLSQLHPFILLKPAHSRPYQFEADVRRASSEYQLTKFHGKIGETDLAGEGSHDLRNDRHQWRANLRSASADLHDLGSLAGIPYPAKSAHPDKFFPQTPIRTERMRALDVHVQLAAKKVATPGMNVVEALRFEADLQEGVLQVKALDVGIAGGHATGEALVDARNEVPHGRAHLKLAGLRLERLFPKLPGEARKAGPLRGTVNLEGTGPSIAAMMGAAGGKLDLAVDGGSISNKLDAKMSLNLGKLAGLMFKGDHDIPIRCAVAGFDFNAGKGKARALLIETEQTRVEGAGAIDLRGERTDLVLVPKPKSPGLLTLGSSININGTFKHPDLQFHKGDRDAPRVASNAQCPGKPAAVAARGGETLSAR